MPPSCRHRAPCIVANFMTRIASELPLAALFLAALLGACASAPPPRQALDAADAGIAAARKLGAEDYAPVELGRAVQRQAAAQVAVSERDYASAERYAVQAELEARLARERTRVALGREDVRKRTEENARLRKELLGEGAVR